MNINLLTQLAQIQAVRNLTSSSNSSAIDFTTIFTDILNSKLTNINTSNSPLTKKQTVSPMLQPFPYVAVKQHNHTDTKFTSYIEMAAKEYNIDPKLIHAVIKHESNYNPNAVSPAGASGLMQLMPRTARSLGVTDIFNVRDNIFAGTKYLRQMLDKYDGDIKLSLAAYNAGPGNVDKYGGIPPFRETQQYVQKVLSNYI